MRTDLGRVRYAEYVDATPERAPLQVRVDGDGIWLIGTPRRGGLSELERDLRRMGLGIADVSWRR
jgi:anaerobic ribonucleoside-triphosphate reductase activating protein